MSGNVVLYSSLVIAALALAAAGWYAMGILKLSKGTAAMADISMAIQEGAYAYLFRQFRVIAIIAVVAFLAIGFGVKHHGWAMAAAFLVGAIFSGIAAYIGMSISSRANVRTAEAARHGLASALGVAVRGGAVTGLSVVGLSLLGVTGFYLFFREFLEGAPDALALSTDLLIGFGFGASLISLFARVGGGIFTKAADVGADLVGKVEAGIPEDDPRNPAVIADNVGDMVGDCAGMGADLFETYAVTLIAAMILAGKALSTTIPSGGGISLAEKGILYPIALGAFAIIASLIGLFFIRLDARKSIMGALYKGLAVTTVVAAVGFLFITGLVFEGRWIPSGAYINIYWAALVGLVITVLINIITEYYTGKYKPVKDIAAASETGAGTNLIMGLAVGLKSTVWPVLVIVAGILAAYHFGNIPSIGNGIYGIAIAAVAMLSTTGIVITMDSYGPITDNAGGIAEMTNLPAEIRVITDELDAVGNTTKAVTKGYAIGSAALAALVLFQAYHYTLDGALAAMGGGLDQAGNLSSFFLDDQHVFVGLIIGALLPFLFSAWCMQAVGRAAHGVVEEVRRQFREIPGIMEGTGRPQYGKAVDIVTKAALREMVAPGILAVVSPLLVGWLLGATGLAGMLAGVIASGLLLALFMSNGGAAWDNAKKYIELGNHGGKGSNAHKAAVVGDTVGDPFKDTAGPALNALIKVINTIALIIAGLLATNLGGVLS